MVLKRPITHSDPYVSVVIPTIPSNELTVLAALNVQTEDQFEVIIVSDASIDRCEARNRGIEAADGDIIAQTDDDCLPPANWVRRIRSYFQENPDKVLLEGTLDKRPLPERHYIGANIAYRRDKALEIGGFDSEFAGWRADTDFGWRMEITHGVDRCHYNRTLQVVHDGPLRTSVDRQKEQKFRCRYPRRYFQILWKTNILFSYSIAVVMAGLYQISPDLGESVFKIGYRLDSLR
jgi:glycosyltransferase involved in cell wall biosynthesis